MPAADPILTALTLMEERLAARIDDRFRDLQLDLDGRFDAQVERDRSDRQDLREQVVDLRRRLGELDDRVQGIEARLPPE